MIYLSGIDTLVIGFYVKVFNLTDEDYKALNTAKELAKAAVFKSSGHLINFKGMDFVIRPAGQRPYTYVLQNNDFTLKLAQKVSYGMFPEIFIELRSQFLWRFGHRHAYNFIKEWVSKWAEIDSDEISKADLSIDSKGFPDIRLKNVVSRARKSKSYLQLVPIQQGETYYYGSKITGWVFGSGPLMIRIYNKSYEVKIVHKEWFCDLWKRSGWDGESDVARVEFQMRREFLKDFNITGFDSFEKSLPDIFKYLTEDWFTLRKPSRDKNRSRWSITPFWSEIQTSIDNFGQIYGLERGRIKEVKEDVLIPQAAGLMTSILASRDNSTLADFYCGVITHLKKKGFTLKEAVTKKKRLNSMFEDGYEPF